MPSYLDAISRMSGLRFEYVNGLSWADSQDALISGKIDVVPDVSKSADVSMYRDGVTVGQPYFVGTMAVVAPEHLNLFFDSRNSSMRWPDQPAATCPCSRPFSISRLPRFPLARARRFRADGWNGPTAASQLCAQSFTTDAGRSHQPAPPYSR
nr:MULTISPECIES: hypothetical protein [unclassified Burkholderia]